MMRSRFSGVQSRYQVPSGYTTAIGPPTHTRRQSALVRSTPPATPLRPGSARRRFRCSQLSQRLVLRGALAAHAQEHVPRLPAELEFLEGAFERVGQIVREPGRPLRRCGCGSHAPARRRRSCRRPPCRCARPRRLASTTWSTSVSLTATSMRVFGTKSTTYSAPRYSSVWPRCRPKPLTSVTVMPDTPSSDNAARTSSSLKGLMIALISFIGLWLLNYSSLSGGDRSSQYAETVPARRPGESGAGGARSAPACGARDPALPDRGARRPCKHSHGQAAAHPVPSGRRPARPVASGCAPAERTGMIRDTVAPGGRSPRNPGPRRP